MKQKLFYMLNDLKEYKQDKSTLMQTYVSERLDKSFAVYEEELQKSILFLKRKHEKSLIKRIKKLDDKSN